MAAVTFLLDRIGKWLFVNMRALQITIYIIVNVFMSDYTKIVDRVECIVQDTTGGIIILVSHLYLIVFII